MSKGFVTRARDGARIKPRISPGARSTSFSGAYCGGAAPVEGRANAEEERYLVKLVGVSASEVSAVRGASGRNKAVPVRGVEAEEVREILTGHLS